LHEKYGDIVRTGPNSVSMNGTIGWPEVFGFTRSGQPEFGKFNDFYQLGDKTALSIFPSDRESHRRQRRILAHAFSDAAIKEQEALITQYVDKLFVHLREHAARHERADMVRWYNFTTFDIIGDLALGQPFGCLDGGDYHPWVAMIFASIKAGAQALALLKMPALSWILRLMVSKENMQKRLESRAISDRKVEQRLALGPAPNGRKDFMTYILRHNDEKGMVHKEILGNSESLIVAGSETTATALSGLTYYITTNPLALRRIQEEIRTAFSTEEEITMRSTAQLKYLTACIEEILRVYPPVAETPPRVSPGETVDGRYIPKGVSDMFPHLPLLYPLNRSDLLPELVQAGTTMTNKPLRLSSQSTSGPSTTIPTTSSNPTLSSPSAGSVPTILSTTRSSKPTRRAHSSPFPLAHATALARIWHTMSCELSRLVSSGTLTLWCNLKARAGRRSRWVSRFGRRFRCTFSWSR
jgi:hypothetical protein